MAGNLMIQGTMSGAGKSILTAGILRVLRQDGYRAAPFKSQNMALNSFVTRDGLEMGRAQAVQAAGAGMEPSADMNPILLKPTGNAESQVIVNGKAVGTMSAAEYYRFKKSLVPEILAAYRRLKERADIIVIEGAGSPVEINLREGDFVNMGLAEMVDAPVLLAGNIDPGGVFAQLLGTIQLLRPGERERVRGLIINKFRGDVNLLLPGLSMFGQYCDIPFAGVVPFMKLDLDEEDSLSERLSGARPVTASSAADTDIAVIRLPYISNYTDFAPLEAAEGVSVRYVSGAGELGRPDLIILPGTKNTLGDLRWLRESGMEREILRVAASDARPDAPLLIGICGGYQMLGKRILDPLGSEGGGSADGLDLLPVETVFRPVKYTRQRKGRTLALPGVWAPLSDLPAAGYEIHMGETRYLREEMRGGAAFAELKRPDEDPHAGGGLSAEGAVRANVLGTYLHGIFDIPELRTALLEMLRERRTGKGPAAGGAETAFSGRKAESAEQMQDRQLDSLADVLRECLDWDLIYSAIGLR